MRSTLAPLLACLILLAGCTQNGGGPRDIFDPAPRNQTGGSPDAPSWTVNDHWVMRAYDEHAPNDTLSVIDQFVQAIDVLTVEGVDMDAFRVVSQQDNRTTWYRMSDLALMKEHVAGGMGLRETVYDRPCALYQWPLEVGATWEESCTRTGPDGASTLNFTARIGSKQDISAAGRDFTTFQIHYQGSDGDRPFERTEYFAPRACFPARILFPQDTGNTVHELIAHQCTAASR